MEWITADSERLDPTSCGGTSCRRNGSQAQGTRRRIHGHGIWTPLGSSTRWGWALVAVLGLSVGCKTDPVAEAPLPARVQLDLQAARYDPTYCENAEALIDELLDDLYHAMIWKDPGGWHDCPNGVDTGAPWHFNPCTEESVEHLTYCAIYQRTFNDIMDAKAVLATLCELDINTDRECDISSMLRSCNSTKTCL